VNLVVDADIAVKWHIRQADSDAAIAVAGAFRDLHAPRFQLLELHQVLAKYVRMKLLDPDLARQSATRHHAMISHWHDSTPLIGSAFELSLLNSHPFYDCLYLALALALDGRIVSADKAFAARFATGKYAGRVVLLANLTASS